MPEKPIGHGGDHRPGGYDPTPTGPWHYVGSAETYADGSACPFVTGANATPTVDVPNPVPMRFRLSMGPLNRLTYSKSAGVITGVTGIAEYTEHQVEIQGDVSGVVAGQTVFVLPLEYRHQYDVPYHTHDDVGDYVPCRLLSTGEFKYGVP